MECQVCKQREATVHLTQIVDDDMRSLDLCEGCAKQKGVSDPVGFALGDLSQEEVTSALGGVVGGGKEAKGAKDSREPKGLECPRCGMSHAEFKKTGRLGCSDCYGVFAEALDGVLKGMHKGIRHTGKVPHGNVGIAARTTGAPGASAASPSVEQLAEDLAAAVAREDFEAAARIRDAMRAIKGASVAPKEGAA